MTSAAEVSREMLLAAAACLEPLLDRLVFVGGTTTGLLVTDPAAAGVRATRDVDAIVEVASRLDFHRLEARLRALGLRPSTEADAPICRWQAGDLVVDVMPTDAAILGFANRWYRDAIRHSCTIEIGPGRSIRCVTAPYFVATKLEAFRGRGDGDHLASHDLEDLLTVIDGRPELGAEIAEAEPALREWVAGELRVLLDDPDFLEALPGHLADSPLAPARARVVRERIEVLAMP